MEWWLIVSIIFGVLGIYGAATWYHESGVILDSRTGKELFFEHMESIRKSDKSRTPVTSISENNSNSNLDSMNAGYFAPTTSKSSFFSIDTSSHCGSSGSDGGCSVGGGE